MNKVNMEEFFMYYDNLISNLNYPDNRCLSITPLYDLIKLQYDSSSISEFNPIVDLITELKGKAPYLKNNIPWEKDTIIYRNILNFPARETFLADFGHLLTEGKSENNISLLPVFFTKDDFHLRDLSKETIFSNMNIKNCLIFKCLISFDNLLKQGFTLVDYNLLPGQLEQNLLNICKFMNLNNEEDKEGHLKTKIQNNIPISYSNEMKAYLKYNELLFRKNILYKNAIEFLKEFSLLKKENIQKTNDDNTIESANLILNENYNIQFNYAILGYEKLMVKLNHLEFVAEHLKSTINREMKDLKRKYLLAKE